MWSLQASGVLACNRPRLVGAIRVGHSADPPPSSLYMGEEPLGEAEGHHLPSLPGAEASLPAFLGETYPWRPVPLQGWRNWMRTACRPLRVCLWKGSHSSITCSENSWFWDVNPLLGSQSALPGSTQGLQVAVGGQPTPGNTVSIEPFPGVPWGWAMVGPVSQGSLDRVCVAVSPYSTAGWAPCRHGP